VASHVQQVSGSAERFTSFGLDRPVRRKNDTIPIGEQRQASVPAPRAMLIACQEPRERGLAVWVTLTCTSGSGSVMRNLRMLFWALFWIS
jgi:hypothetical protein